MAEINFPDNALDADTFEIAGKLYTYNAAKNLWTGTSITPSIGTGVPPDSLGALSDVALSGVQAGQLFYYNGTSWINSQTTIDDIFIPASQKFTVTTEGLIYKINEINYAIDNPNIVLASGTTIAFKLNCVNHPFKIQFEGSDYGIAPGDTSLTHVAPDGTVSTGSAAQGQELGTLYWKIPYNLTGVFTYRCSIHASMTGNIYVRSNTGSDVLGTHTLVSGALSLDLGSSNIFKIDIPPDDAITSIAFNQPAPSVFNNWTNQITLILTTSTNNTVLWQTAGGTIFWADGISPTLNNSTTYVVKILALEGGLTYYATLLASGSYGN